MLQYSCSFNQPHSHRTLVAASPLKAYREKHLGNVHFTDPVGGRKGFIWYALISSISHNVLIAVLSVVLIWTGRHSPDDKFNWNQTCRCLWSYFFPSIYRWNTETQTNFRSCTERAIYWIAGLVCLLLCLVLTVHHIQLGGTNASSWASKHTELQICERTGVSAIFK